MQRSLASTIRQSRDTRRPVTVVQFQSYRAHAARDIDNASRALRFEQQRPESLGDEVDACGVGVEIRGHVLAGGFFEGDGGVVDQDVEAAVGFFDGFGGGGDAGVVGLVDLEEFAGAFVAFRSQFLDGGLALSRERAPTRMW